MGLSRPPLLSLLCLFGALLWLSPEIAMGKDEGPSDMPITDPKQLNALIFGMEDYNWDRSNSINYYKVSSILYAWKLVDVDQLPLYNMMVEVVKTICKKKGKKRRKFEKVQTCKLLPGNQKPENCYFIVKNVPLSHEMTLVWSMCLEFVSP